jgi:quercetin dioxygenase-like cupin family protein
MVLARHGPVSVMLIVFEPQGFLKEHRADGEVVIQGLTGRVQVTAGDAVREIGPGELIALAPGIPHSVRALAASDLLVSVHKQAVAPGSA